MKDREVQKKKTSKTEIILVTIGVILNVALIVLVVFALKTYGLSPVFTFAQKIWEQTVEQQENKAGSDASGQPMPPAADVASTGIDERQADSVAVTPVKQDAPHAEEAGKLQAVQTSQKSSTSRPPVSIEGSSIVVREESHAGYTSYHFENISKDMQLYEMAYSDGKVYVGSSLGLVEYREDTGTWKLYGKNSGMPGDKVDEVAIANGTVFCELLEKMATQNAVRSLGVYSFDPETGVWAKRFEKFVWGIHSDGKKLWLATVGGGVYIFDPVANSYDRYTIENSGLRTNSILDIAMYDGTVWFAQRGDRYDRSAGGYTGGGVTSFNMNTNEWKQYSVDDGLIRDYVSGVAVDDREVWVAYYGFDNGLSVLDRDTGAWRTVKLSSNGVLLGGDFFFLDPNTVWVAQRMGLVVLNRQTLHADKYTMSNGMPGLSVSALAVSREHIWVAAYSLDNGEAGLVRFDRRG